MIYFMMVTEPDNVPTVSTKVAALIITTVAKYISIEVFTNPSAFQLAFPIILVMVICGCISVQVTKKVFSKYLK
jgi:uncharacterized membrane protein YjjB (DUF3815 family)